MREPTDAFCDIAAQLFDALRDRPNAAGVVSQVGGATGGRRALSIAVSSTGRGEGKTFVAEGLGLHAAVLGTHRILLADANCARPVLTERHRGAGKAGLTDFARGDMPEILPTDAPNLHVVGIGRRPQPLLLFRDGIMEGFVAWAAERCDVLLLDAGALGEAGTSVVTAAAGRVLLVIDSSRTAREAVRAAVDRSGQRERIWGVALNKRRTYVPAFLDQRA